MTHANVLHTHSQTHTNPCACSILQACTAGGQFCSAACGFLTRRSVNHSVQQSGRLTLCTHRLRQSVHSSALFLACWMSAGGVGEHHCLTPKLELWTHTEKKNATMRIRDYWKGITRWKRLLLLNPFFVQLFFKIKQNECPVFSILIPNTKMGKPLMSEFLLLRFCAQIKNKKNPVTAGCLICIVWFKARCDEIEM